MAEGRVMRIAIVDGPNFGAIMNSLAGPQLGDAYSLSFIAVVNKQEYAFSGKAVGLELRDVDDVNLWGLRIQLEEHLQDYNPVRLQSISAILSTYNTRSRKGSALLSQKAALHLGLSHVLELQDRTFERMEGLGGQRSS